METLAVLERRAGSVDEQRAAEWIAERLDRAGAQTRMEEELFYDGYARQLLPFGLACLATGVWALIARRRLLPAVIAAAARNAGKLMCSHP